MNDVKHLLIVSTEECVSDPMVARLAEFGYQISCARNAQELEVIYSQTPTCDLIIYEVNFVQIATESLFESLHRIGKLYPNIEIVGVYAEAPAFDIITVFGAGITAIAHLPYEHDQFLNIIFEKVPIELPVERLTFSALSRIEFPELETIGELPFDLFVFLAMNKRIILYRRKGTEPDKEWIEKHTKIGSLYPLFVRKTDLAKYRAFRASRMAKIVENKSLTDSERAGLLREEVSNLLSGILMCSEFSVSEGLYVLESARRVMLEFLGKAVPNREIYERLISLISQNRTNHSHAINVSAYCSIFGIIQGIEDFQSLNIAGLLHDIGMSELPGELSEKLRSAYTADELDLYKTHSFLSLEVIRKRNIPISDDVANMILQHHEHTDGSGFPGGIKSDEISPGAKICAFADIFDELTSVRSGQHTYTPVQALQKIAGLKGEPPEPIFDPKFHGPLVSTLLKSQIAPLEVHPGTESDKVVEKSKKKVPSTGAISKK